MRISAIYNYIEFGAILKTHIIDGICLLATTGLGDNITYMTYIQIVTRYKYGSAVFMCYFYASADATDEVYGGFWYASADATILGVSMVVHCIYRK